MENTKTKISAFSAFAILSVAMVWNFETAAVAPCLGILAKAFAKETDFKIQLVATLPFITSFIFSVISGYLSKYFDKKAIAVVGLLTYGVTGMLPAFINNINIILILRLFTGIGVGLVMPLPNQIIVEHYDGEPRKKMLGLTTTSFNIMNVVISTIVGFLLVFGWRVSFYCFAIIFVILLVVVLGLPKSPPLAAEKNESNVKNKNEKLPGYVIGMFLVMVFFWIMFGGFSVTVSMFITSEKVSPLWTSGFLLAMPGLISAIIGLLFAPLLKLLKRFYPFFAFMINGAGFFCLFFSHSPFLLFLGAALFGVGSGAMVPYILYNTSNHVNEYQKDRALGVVSSGIHCGGFISAFAILLVMFIEHATTYRDIYITYGIICCIGAVIALILSIGKMKYSIKDDSLNSEVNV
jgi:MFS family permease